MKAAIFTCTVECTLNGITKYGQLHNNTKSRGSLSFQLNDSFSLHNNCIIINLQKIIVWRRFCGKLWHNTFIQAWFACTGDARRLLSQTLPLRRLEERLWRFQTRGRVEIGRRCRRRFDERRLCFDRGGGGGGYATHWVTSGSSSFDGDAAASCVWELWAVC